MFATDGVAEEDREKVDDLIATEAAAGKTHALADGCEHPLLAQVARHKRDFAQPAGC